jgi:glycerol-3-phosphate acyltransferase PlsX
LGITKPVIKAHGSSNAWAIRNACRQARDFAQSTYISDVEANIEFMKVSGETENA